MAPAPVAIVPDYPVQAGVSAVAKPSRTRGRVALAGGAAACPSLLAGQGSALAMIEAYVLAAELARASDDHIEAFARYGAPGPTAASKQDAARFLGVAVRGPDQGGAGRAEHRDEAHFT